MPHMLAKLGRLSSAVEGLKKRKHSVTSTTEEVEEDQPLCWATLDGPLELLDVAHGISFLDLSDDDTPTQTPRRTSRAEEVSKFLKTPRVDTTVEESSFPENDGLPRAESPSVPIHIQLDVQEGLGDDVSLHQPLHPIMLRPSLARKAVTAPAGSVKMILVSKPPRRAISARTANTLQVKSNEESRDVSPMSPRSPHPGGTAYRTIISRQRNGKLSGGRVGLKPKGNVWRLASTSPRTVGKVAKMSNRGRGGWWTPERERSFSQRPRVGEALHKKRVEALRTSGIVDFGAKQLPDTPSSMALTPKEFYFRRTPPDISPITPSMRRRALQEISSNKQRSHSTPLTPVPWNASTGSNNPPISERRGSARSARVTLRSGSTLTVTSPEVSPWEHKVYVPGPIRIQKRYDVPAVPRKGSVASLEPFLGAVDEFGEEPRRASDDALLDDLVEYFKHLGIVNPIGEDVLDKFWERSSRPPKTVPVTISPRWNATRSARGRQNTSDSLTRSSPGRLPPPSREKLKRLLGYEEQEIDEG